MKMAYKSLLLSCRPRAEASSTFSYQTPTRSSSIGSRSIEREQQPPQPSPSRLPPGALPQGLGVKIESNNLLNLLNLLLPDSNQDLFNRV